MNPKTSLTAPIRTQIMHVVFARLFALLLVFPLACAAGEEKPSPSKAAALAPIAVPRIQQDQVEIEMFVGETRVLPHPNVGRLAVGNGKVLSATALDDKEILLIANEAGVSSLHVWARNGRSQRLKVRVLPGDMARITRELVDLLGSLANVTVRTVGENIVVDGDDLSDRDLDRISEIAKRFPNVINFTNRLGWEKMVELEVKVVELPVTELREMGLRWGTRGGAAIGAVWGPIRRGNDGPYQIDIPTGPKNTPPISNPSGGPLKIPPGLNILSLLNLGLSAQLDLLEQNGKAAILAAPTLSVRSGSTAEFLAGGEIPYTISNINGTTVQFKPYGINLKITPRVDHRGVVRATLLTEVSYIDSSISTPSGPGISTRRTSTEFNVREGETIVLSGLLSRENSTTVDKVPFLGDLPILGPLFRSKRYQNKETELVVFVTPRIVTAADTRAQTFRERMERGAADVFTPPTQKENED